MDNIEKQIIEICENDYEQLMSLENVIGVGLGYKQTNGIITNEDCLHVLVSKKVPLNYLNSNSVVPKIYKSIQTDVIESGRIKARNSLTSKIRPLQGGYCISAGGQKDFSGTIGCIVTRKSGSTNQYFILSNSHVLSGENKFTIGTNIIQPANIDGGKNPKDKVAILSKNIPVKFKGRFSTPVNYTDCAMAKITDDYLVSDLIALIGKVKGIARPSRSMAIKKTGITTGLTKGKITTINATTEVEFFNNKIALFKNQVIADIANEEGDSGALVCSLSNQAVGLLFAGNEKSCFFTDITSVLRVLDVEIFTK